MRIGACRLCIFSNSTLKFTSGADSLLKIHEGENQTAWNGQYTEIFEISDNLFTHGPPNGYSISYAPQNAQKDERLRYGILERNLWMLNNGEATGPHISASYTTARNNVVYVATGGGTVTTAYGLHANTELASIPNQPYAIEYYNNTCYVTNTTLHFTGSCVYVPASTNSFAANNLLYNAGIAQATAGNTAGNTMSNNTSDSTATFSPTNGSGTFSVITDFTPTQNYSGGTDVPAWYDAHGVAWSPTWSLGALKP